MFIKFHGFETVTQSMDLYEILHSCSLYCNTEPNLKGGPEVKVIMTV